MPGGGTRQARSGATGATSTTGWESVRAFQRSLETAPGRAHAVASTMNWGTVMAIVGTSNTARDVNAPATRAPPVHTDVPSVRSGTAAVRKTVVHRSAAWGALGELLFRCRAVTGGTQAGGAQQGQGAGAGPTSKLNT